MKEIRILILTLIFISFYSCDKKKTINLKLIYKTEVDSNENEKMNSKIAYSDSIFLLKSNQFYHQVNQISNSETTLFIKGRKVITNMSYESLVKKYKLKELELKKFIFTKNDSINDLKDCLKINISNSNKLKGFKNIIKKSKYFGIFQYFQNRNYKTASLNICNSEINKNFDFKVKGYLPTINLIDITGDQREELFVFETNDNYIGNTYSIKIYNIYFE